jgi:5-methyltetrahydrofolate--homocysteine methyltransferase
MSNMLIVGERINTSRKVKGEPVIEKAVVERDAEFIRSLAKTQVESGAHYIDVNCGTLPTGEPEALEWITKTVQDCVEAPICFDTPNPAALERALGAYDRKRGQPFINSITAEKKRYADVLPFVLDTKGKVIALSMDDTGIQQDPAIRHNVARKLIADLAEAGVPLADIYIDPMTFPIGSGDDVAVAMLSIIEKLKAEFAGVQTIAGLSNVSHGMPARKVLNCAMTVLCLGKGLDAGIVDPRDKTLMGLIAAAEALLGKDEYCSNYIAMARAGAFEGI